MPLVPNNCKCEHKQTEKQSTSRDGQFRMPNPKDLNPRLSESTMPL